MLLLQTPHRKSPNLAIILWTGYSDKILLEQKGATTIALGVDVLIHKPVSIDLLPRSVKEIILKKVKFPDPL